MIPTPHIELTDPRQMAKTVLMPGDPLRAKFIAEEFLTEVILINQVRNMLGYTGRYLGKEVTVFASGMGLSSMGIYSYELYQFYDVDQIIRIGSAGAYTAELKLYDLVLATAAYSEANFAKTQDPTCREDMLWPDPSLVESLESSARQQNIQYHKGRIHTSEVFYKKDANDYERLYQEKGCLCAEMESFALFHNANISGKRAACLLTISDSLVTHELTTAKERERSFVEMIRMALGILQ